MLYIVLLIIARPELPPVRPPPDVSSKPFPWRAFLGKLPVVLLPLWLMNWCLLQSLVVARFLAVSEAPNWLLVD